MQLHNPRPPEPLDGGSMFVDLLAMYLSNRPKWMTEAACIDAGFCFVDAERTRAATAAAMQVCGTCPALVPCRAWALAPEQADMVGIIAGTDTAARKAIRRNRESRPNA